MLKIARLTFLPAFLFIFSAACSQDRIIDSLKIVLKNPKLHDTTRIRAISDVMESNYNDSDKNYYYLNTMLGKLVLKNYKKSDDPELQKKYATWLATYYCTVATYYSHTDERKKGFAYHDKAIAILKAMKIYDEMYMVFIVKASLYCDIERDDKALPLLFAALKYYEKDKELYNDQLGYISSVLSHIYSGQEKHEKAIEYSKKAIGYYDVSDAPAYQTSFLKSQSYANIAASYGKMEKFREAIYYCNKVLEISKKIGADSETGYALSWAGDAQMGLSNFDEAEKLYKEILSMSTLSKSVDDAAITRAYIGLGRLYFKKGDFTKAGFYADKSFPLSKKTGSIGFQKNAADLIYDISKATGNFKKALEMYQYHEKIVDSSQIEASKNELAQQLLKYNFEKKELRLKFDAGEKNAVKNNWLIGLSGLLLLLLLGGYFYYRNNRQKQAITLLEKDQIRQKLLVTQMNPHFIFNSIQNIQGLIYDKKDEEAVNYLNKFSALTRQILENSNENYISLTEEVEMIKNYIAIQQLLYHNKFGYTIAIEDKIEPENIFLPPMLTQPFIENAIKHGLSNTEENGMIAITFYLAGNKLFFEVSDNGKGFDAVKKPTSHKSLAMTITKERLIGYTKNKDFVVHTDNITDQNTKVIGAKVRFEIPYIYEN